MRRLLFAAAACSLLCCVGPEDVPSRVHDLRVLGVKLDPPELLAPACVFDFEDPAAQAALAAWSQPVRYTALIADPRGNGRELAFELWACARTSDRTCDERGERFQLAPEQGEPASTPPGELTVEVTPALLGVDLAAGDFEDALLLQVLEADPYRGLGGIRVPLVLDLEAGDERIFAQKLMVYSCNFFPGPPGSEAPTMTQNQNPELPGVTVDGEAWEEGEVPTLTGPGPFAMEPEPFADREEAYVVPSFELEPLPLEERWRVAWHADLGQFSPNQTGGAAYGGEEVRHRVEWLPPPDAKEQDVRFWIVVRDGRGGTSWLTRTAHYQP